MSRFDHSILRYYKDLLSEIKDNHEVDPDSGKIQGPGKYEGEQLYCPLLYSVCLDGSSDEYFDIEDIAHSFVEVDAELNSLFPELPVGNFVKIHESNNGFVYAVVLTPEEKSQWVEANEKEIERMNDNGGFS